MFQQKVKEKKENQKTLKIIKKSQKLNPKKEKQEPLVGQGLEKLMLMVGVEGLGVGKGKKGIKGMKGIQEQQGHRVFKE